MYNYKENNLIPTPKHKVLCNFVRQCVKKVQSGKDKYISPSLKKTIQELITYINRYR